MNLRNANYQILNTPYSKEAYEEKIRKLNSGTFSGLNNVRQEFLKLILAFPHRFATIVHSTNVSGEYITNSKNCHNCYDVDGIAEDSRFITYTIPGVKDCYDVYGAGSNIERAYEVTSSGASLQNAFFSPLSWTGDSIQYSHFCKACSNIFGCIGLRDKQYCILNKQYTKEDFESFLPRIIQHMNDAPYIDKKGRVYKYGEFFPIEISPFAYNETIAQEYFPLTKAQAIEQGYKWKDSDTKEYQITIFPKDLPDNIEDAPDSILKKTIGCAHEGKCMEQCTTAFRITPEELSFYKRLNLPLPRLCPNCRHYQRLAQRNPLKLWHRKCQCAGNGSENGIYRNVSPHQHGTGKCPNEFKTSYAADRKEIVYCEQCYQAEVV
ncbi:MAG: hypothetical protein V1885_03505 [Candidatus Brennerbacteria bacterium]